MASEILELTRSLMLRDTFSTRLVDSEKELVALADRLLPLLVPPALLNGPRTRRNHETQYNGSFEDNYTTSGFDETWGTVTIEVTRSENETIGWSGGGGRGATIKLRVQSLPGDSSFELCDWASASFHPGNDTFHGTRTLTVTGPPAVLAEIRAAWET